MYASRRIYANAYMIARRLCVPMLLEPRGRWAGGRQNRAGRREWRVSTAPSNRTFSAEAMPWRCCNPCNVKPRRYLGRRRPVYSRTIYPVHVLSQLGATRRAPRCVRERPVERVGCAARNEGRELEDAPAHTSRRLDGRLRQLRGDAFVRHWKLVNDNKSMGYKGHLAPGMAQRCFVGI